MPVTGATVAAVTNAQGPKRKRPLDNLAPREFDDSWPQGVVTPPEKLDEKGYDENQVDSIIVGVELVQQLARDIERWLSSKKMTQEKLARNCATTRTTVANLRNGEVFPVRDTYLLLRGRVPSQADMDRNDFRDRVVAQKEDRSR